LISFLTSLTFPSNGSNTNLAFLTSTASNMRPKRCTQTFSLQLTKKFGPIHAPMSGSKAGSRKLAFNMETVPLTCSKRKSSLHSYLPETNCDFLR
jgi:hypothetical protein